MVNKEISRMIVLSVIDAMMLIVTSLYIGVVVFYMEQYLSAKTDTNYTNLFIATLMVFAILIGFLFYHKWLRSKMGIKE